MKALLKFDIWNNLTYVDNGEIWYKQTFIEAELISYEDYLGNYWTKDFGEFQFLLVTVPFIDNFDQWEGLKEVRLENTINIIGEWGWFNITSSVRRVLSGTISQDLVPVVPLEAPTGNLFYIDYVYDGKKEELTRYQKLKSWFKKIKGKFSFVVSDFFRIFV